MGVFDDKKFEALDWMTQITETIESDLGGLLARLPDRLEIDISLINSLVSNSLNLSTGSVVRHLLSGMSNIPSITWEENRVLQECFQFEVTGENIEVDLGRQKISGGSLALIKIKSAFEDEEISKFLGMSGIQRIGSCNRNNTDIGRLNEVMELLGGCESELKGRAIRRKVAVIQSRLGVIFKNNEWRIRDAALANKVGLWITDYILNGNLAAFSNFCKLKVMTHHNMPIYSIEEQE